MPFGLKTQVDPRNHVNANGSPDPPREGAVLRGKRQLAVKYSNSLP